MQGPIPWWDQPPDSRDNTVSMPRVDPAEFADGRSSAGSPGPDGHRDMPERPAFGDPYALPAQPGQAQPTARQRPDRWPEPGQRPVQSMPGFEPAASSHPEAAAAPEPEAAELPDREAAELPDREAAELPDREAGARPESGAAAPEPDAAAPRVDAAQAQEPEDDPAPEPAARAPRGDAAAATTAAQRARTAATAEATAARVARSVPAPESERVAPVAVEHVAELSRRDLQSGQPAGSAGLGPPARQAVRTPPEHQAATETSLGVPSVPAGAADRPAAGSIADLRARLARLPAGHPASPHDDTGRPKPAPIRLRMLELGLPARPGGVASGAETANATGISIGEEGNGAATGARPDTASSVGSARSAETATGTGTSSSGSSASGTAPGSSRSTGTGSSGGTAGGAGRADGPLPVADDVSAPRPAVGGDDANGERRPRPAEEAATRDPRADGSAPSDRRHGSAAAQPPASGRNGHRDRSTSADWQRPYDVPRDADHRIDGPAPLDRTDLTTASWPTIDVPPRNGDHRNGKPGGESSDSTPPRTANRPAQRSQPGPTDPGQRTARTPAGGRSSRPVVANRLSPAQRELVDRILAACRAAEGRNTVGGYGSSGLTPAMMRIAAHLPLGGLAPGSEANTLKSADRLAAKLARLLARQPGRSAEQVAASIGDAIRYAFTFDTTTYTEGTLLVHRKLKTQGFELEARRNRWDSPEYKGVFTRWRDPAHGLPFEVQFHTGQSWAFVQRTHGTYVRITDPATSPTERARLRAQQATAADVVQQPPGWREIADFRAGAREQPR
jgi:hypothetical protein